MIHAKKNSSYYINARALSFSENDLGSPQRVAVSLASGTAILVHIPGTIDYAADGSYEKWTLSGYSTKLLKNDAYFIFARLSRTERTALLIFSVNDYDINGKAEVKGTDEEGNETVTAIGPSEDFYYIKLGTLTATNGTSLRSLTYDSGLLSTDKGRDQSGASDMFELDKVSVPPLIKVKQWFYEFTVKNPITLLGGLIFGTKKVTDIKRSTDDDVPVSDETVPSTLYASTMNDGRYLRKDQDDRTEHSLEIGEDLSVDGSAFIATGLDVGGSADIGGDATIHGSTSISGNSTVEGTSTVGKNIHVEYDSSTEQPTDKALTIGNFIEEGDLIQGAQITKSGVASFAGVKSPFMQIYELILNRKTAVQGEFAFSDGDTVDNVTLNEDGTYTLSLRAQYEGYITSFKYDDIIYANINIIGNSGEPATTGKCWMRVNSIAYDGLTINVSLYSDEQVPSGTNIVPQPHMMITRHGNETDKTRQDVWIISSEDGRMYQLTGVDSPIINSATAYATVWGKLPQNLVEYIQQHVTNFNPQHPYLYARGAVIQDLILLNYKGAVVKTENYRGIWSYETAVNDPYITNESTYDTVTHNGSKWMVQVSNTTVEPSLTVTEWVQVVAKGEDASLSMYEIKPSVNVVYVREGKIVSTKSLTVTVGETTPSGYEVLDTQYKLEEKGLRIQYAVDGSGERITLDIGGDASAIELEDGTGIIVDESDDDAVIVLEGESIDVSAIEDNITLYLVDNEGNDIHQFIVPVIKDGVTPFVSFKSMVFIRSNGTPDKPTDGDYENPVPTGWNDGIPSGTEPIWSTSRVFSTDPNFVSEWDEPQLFADTPDIKMVYSSDKEYYTIPDGFDASDEWYDSAALHGWNKLPDEKTIWMAVSRFTASVWSEWEIIKVKGEKGTDGKSIKIKGTLESADLLPAKPDDDSDCYVIAGDLWVWVGTGWSNAGKFSGDNGKSSYLHVKYANSLTPDDWTDKDGETAGMYIGIYVSEESEDPLVWDLYTWSKFEAVDGASVFKSTVFTRSDEAPSTPEGGSYDSPKPETEGWSDGIPEGDGMLWASTRVFTSNGLLPQQEVWTTPQQMSDTTDFDVIYSVLENPEPPTGHPVTNTEVWQNDETSDAIWMATSRMRNNVWSEWYVTKIKGEKGDPGSAGQTSFKSFVFLRSDEEPSTPEGGNYDSPLPSPLNGWSDGTPNGTERLWMSTRIFSSDGLYPQQDAWSKPEPLADSTDFDVEYSSVENPSFPTGHPNTNPEWSNISDTTTIWMATSKKSNGEWSDWQVQKIKGEKGDKGSGIAVKGAFATLDELKAKYPNGPENDGDCYVVGNYLYAWNGSEWINIGQIAGENGINGKDSIRIDLDNENDSMLYDSDGNLLSGAVTSDISLYEGDKEVVADFTIIGSENVNASIEGDTLTVTGCTAASGYVKVGCIYKEQLYSAKMTIKRIVNGVKYEIEANPNVVTYNETTETMNPQAITVSIYRTAQTEDGTVKRERVTSLPTGWRLDVAGYSSVSENNGLWNVIPDPVEYTFVYIKLLDSNGTSEDEESIPILRVKNGDKGESIKGDDGHSYTLQASKLVIESLVDATTGLIMTGKAHFLDFTYCIDNVPHTLTTSDTLYADGFGEDIPSRGLAVVSGVARLAFSIKGGVAPDTDNITVSVTPVGLPTATTSIAISHPQRGLVGPAGQIGLMLYPQGYWDENTIYTQVKDDEGNAVATPFVYYQNEQGAGDYYVLQQDLPNAGIDPSTDDTQTYWKKFQKFQYLFTEALMANWARLAKSVFWGDYMFSTKGVNQAGEVVDHTAYMGTDNPMFDSNTNRLTGALIPNLFLDLENGLVKTNKLSETFRPFRAKQNYPDASYGDACSDILTLNTSYNVKCKAGVKVLFMPLLTDIKASNGSTYMYADVLDTDGIHSTVSVFPDTEYERLINSSLISINAGSTTLSGLDYQEACGYSVLLCADPRILARSSYKYGLDGGATETKYAPHNVILNDAAFFRDDLDMFFSFGGTLSKWLLLEPGSTVSLRLIESDGQHIWIVENANDFDQLDARVGISFDSSANNDEGFSWITGGVIGLGNSNTDELSDLGINRTGRFYGSKRLRLLYDAQTTKNTVNIGVYVTSNSYADNTTVMEIADEIEGVEISN